MTIVCQSIFIVAILYNDMELFAFMHVIIIYIQGGERTRDEMCLSFPVYYPRPRNRQNLDYCVSFPTFPNAFAPFKDKYAP